MSTNILIIDNTMSGFLQKYKIIITLWFLIISSVEKKTDIINSRYLYYFNRTNAREISLATVKRYLIIQFTSN